MADDIAGTVPGQLFGGPLDGTKYGDLPDLGEPYTGMALSVPLAQPADESARAVYLCEGAAPVNGWWQFFYVRTDQPGAVEAPDATQVALHATQMDAATQVALARAIATLAHRGQIDKAGVDYIGHPARVAARFDPQAAPLEHCAAWLHDVIEDTTITAEDLRSAGIHPEVVEVVELLTRSMYESRDEYYLHVAEVPVARAVKAADIDDNLDVARLQLLHPAIRERLIAKYAHAREVLRLADGFATQCVGSARGVTSRRAIGQAPTGGSRA